MTQNTTGKTAGTIEGTCVTIDEILKYLPHRYPFLLIDKVVDIKPFESAVGIKNVTYSEPWFTGHFPQTPVFPGVLIIEAMAQAAAIMIAHSSKMQGIEVEAELVYFMSIDKVRFRQPAKPGDQMHFHVQTLKHRLGVYKFGGKVKVDGNLIAEGEVMVMNVKNEH